MSMFISKALRRAEVFLEQVDESVAQASRRLVVEGATGSVELSEDLPSSDDEAGTIRRASAIPRAEERAAQQMPERKDDRPEEVPTSYGETSADDGSEEAEDAWGVDVDIGENEIEVDAETKDPTLEESVRDGSEVVTEEVGEHRGASESPNEVEVQEVLPPAPSLKKANSNAFMSIAAQSSTSSAGLAQPTTQSRLSMSVSAPTAPKPPTSKPATSRLKQSASAEAFSSKDGEYIDALKQENTELRKELELAESDFGQSRKERGKLVKNLKRMKEIVSEMDESLREKSAEARGLETKLVAAKDEINTLRAISRENDARGKDGMDILRKELNAEIENLQQEVRSTSLEAGSLREENERLKEALVHGNEVDLATADGARQEASQAHHAYEAETQAHRETRKQAKEREEALEAEAALATKALAGAQRKAEECTVAASNAKSAQRAAETKLTMVTSARDAAYARVEDLEDAVRRYERGENNAAPSQNEVNDMQETVSELENALEAKNVELSRLEGEVESLRGSLRARRDANSPRASGQAGRGESTNHQEVEVKLRHMADAALRKQAQLEVLRSENRALQHQLTTERKRTREAQAMAAAASSSGQSIRGGFRGILDGGDEDRGDRVYGVRDGPLARFRTPRTWPRSVSNAVTGMDRFSAQALAFLRKEPLLRIVILIYLVAMHLFVYSLLHWHVGTVTGSPKSPHESVASAQSGGQIRNHT